MIKFNNFTKINEINTELPFQIFCDMDDTITDYPRAVEEEHESRATGNPYNDLTFWEHMPWTKDGKELWNYIKRYDPIIISAPDNTKHCIQGKKKWVERELGPDVHKVFPNNKGPYAELFPDVTSVLIDDDIRHINEWKKSGGMGILHTSAENSIKELQKLGI